jgi:hypothetical protein
MQTFLNKILRIAHAQDGGATAVKTSNHQTAPAQPRLKVHIKLNNGEAEEFECSRFGFPHLINGEILENPMRPAMYPLKDIKEILIKVV